MKANFKIYTIKEIAEKLATLKDTDELARLILNMLNSIYPNQVGQKMEVLSFLFNITENGAWAIHPDNLGNFFNATMDLI